MASETWIVAGDTKPSEDRYSYCGSSTASEPEEEEERRREVHGTDAQGGYSLMDYLTHERESSPSGQREMNSDAPKEPLSNEEDSLALRLPPEANGKGDDTLRSTDNAGDNFETLPSVNRELRTPTLGEERQNGVEGLELDIQSLDSTKSRRSFREPLPLRVSATPTDFSATPTNTASTKVPLPSSEDSQRFSTPVSLTHYSSPKDVLHRVSSKTSVTTTDNGQFLRAKSAQTEEDRREEEREREAFHRMSRVQEELIARDAMVSDLRYKLHLAKNDNEKLQRQLYASGSHQSQERTKNDALTWEQWQESQRYMDRLKRQNAEADAVISHLRHELSELRSTLRQYERHMGDLDEKLRAANVAAAQKAKLEARTEIHDVAGPLQHENMMLHERLEQQDRLITSLQKEIAPPRPRVCSPSPELDATAKLSRLLDSMESSSFAFEAQLPRQNGLDRDPLNQRHDLVMRHARFALQQTQHNHPHLGIKSESPQPRIPPPPAFNHRSRVIEAAVRAGIRRMPSPDPLPASHQRSPGVSRLLKKYRGNARRDVSPEKILADSVMSPRPEPQCSVYSMGRLIYEAEEEEDVDESELRLASILKRRGRKVFEEVEEEEEEEDPVPPPTCALYGDRCPNMHSGLPIEEMPPREFPTRSPEFVESREECPLIKQREADWSQWKLATGDENFGPWGKQHHHEADLEPRQQPDQFFDKKEADISDNDLHRFSSPSAKVYADRLIQRYMAGLRK